MRFNRGDDEFILHMGLGTWFKVNGRHVNINHDNPNDSWEKYTGISIGNFERAYNRVHGPKKKCPKCGNKNLDWVSGYVGESMQFCHKCESVLYCEPITESMI